MLRTNDIDLRHSHVGELTKPKKDERLKVLHASINRQRYGSERTQQFPVRKILRMVTTCSHECCTWSHTCLKLYKKIHNICDLTSRIHCLGMLKHIKNVKLLMLIYFVELFPGEVREIARNRHHAKFECRYRFDLSDTLNYH